MKGTHISRNTQRKLSGVNSAIDTMGIKQLVLIIDKYNALVAQFGRDKVSRSFRYDAERALAAGYQLRRLTNYNKE